MKIRLARLGMRLIAFTGLLRYPLGHRIFGYLYGVRIRSGEWGRLNRE